MKKSQIKNELTMKQLDTQDVNQFHELLRYAFQVTEKDLFHFGWDNEEIKQSKSPILKNAHVLGWFHKYKLVSQIALYPMQMNIYNTIYKMGGITGVATYPEYSGIGLMMDLMHEILKVMRKNKQSISCLYPYSIPYYRSRGWEIVSDKMTFSLADHQVPRTPSVEGMIQRVSQNHPDLIALHDIFAKQTHGCLIRDNLAWNEYWRWDVDDEIIAIYYDKDDNPTGYIVYLLENDVFKIKELIYLNKEARYGIWGYINAHQSMFDRVEGLNFSNHNLAFLLEDGHIKETTQPYIMARIVDVEQFLSQYPFDTITFETTLSFIVHDVLLEWNNRIFTLCFKENHVYLEITPHKYQKDSMHTLNISYQDSHTNTLEIDIQTLTTMLLGYKRPLYLREIGRLNTNDHIINLLEEILPEGKAYFSDYF
ncbi:GNAT family N-acetyltransferase [Helicobacter didelphidarum]|uniref:GNAT family N-acetyltransferase n=1 Tax=Helicobacter didelphidarum TaxID=2040648 RepID=A0A3D8INE3_9HELI|nr:GNAT family N-acetyltransferase [Helicobacter didelphidarum]RDU66797.1 GNAT family N-acetyltransferase [Helicobacter didelphidarum]